MLVFRFRFLLEITGRVPPLYPTHWALVYALICEANGLILRTRSALPEGILPLAPERLRVHLESGDQYAFGLTLLAESTDAATEIVLRLQQGLEQLGRGNPARGKALSGNFRLLETRDLVADQIFTGQMVHRQ